MSCVLCNIMNGDKKTSMVFEDKLIQVVNCPKCGEPLVVLKEHRANISDIDDILIDRIEWVRDFMYPKRTIKYEQELSDEHWHCHILR